MKFTTDASGSQVYVHRNLPATAARIGFTGLPLGPFSSNLYLHIAHGQA